MTEDQVMVEELPLVTDVGLAVRVKAGTGVTTVLLAEQFTSDPPFDPEQVQLHGPEPETPEAVPALQSPEDGAVATVVPFALPQEPFITFDRLIPHHDS